MMYVWVRRDWDPAWRWALVGAVATAGHAERIGKSYMSSGHRIWFTRRVLEGGPTLSDTLADEFLPMELDRLMGHRTEDRAERKRAVRLADKKKKQEEEQWVRTQMALEMEP